MWLARRGCSAAGDSAEQPERASQEVVTLGSTFLLDLLVTQARSECLSNQQPAWWELGVL